MGVKSREDQPGWFKVITSRCHYLYFTSRYGISSLPVLGLWQFRLFDKRKVIDKMVQYGQTGLHPRQTAPSLDQHSPPIRPGRTPQLLAKVQT